MSIKIFKVLRESNKNSKNITTKLKPAQWYGGGIESNEERIRKQIEKSEIININVDGEISPSPVYREKKSYWYCFLTSLDRKQDINILKEILFWGTIYHNDDSVVEILIPGWAGERYYYYRNVFQVNQIPCLILTDNKEYPVDSILLSKNFINTENLGDNFTNLREVLDFFHNILINDNSLKKVNKVLLKKRGMK